MNIYLLTQDENDDYDTFDSMVVMAESAEAAANIHPHYNAWWSNDDDSDDPWANNYSSWTSSPNNVKVSLVGKLDSDYPQDNKIICSSFNAS